MRSIQSEPGTGRAARSEARISNCGKLYAGSRSELHPVGAHSARRHHDDWHALSPSRPKQWVPKSKAEVVVAVRCELLSLHEACERYTLSIEEYLTFLRVIDFSGISRLRVSKKRLCLYTWLHSTDC
jgi:hypothetical protein